MIRVLFRFGLFPLAGYAICFVILTYPQALRFADAFYCDDGDGPATIWGLWWVRHAIIELIQSPWQTNYLHSPHGTTLLLHTLSPLKGLLAIPLAAVLPSAVVVYNTLFISSFAISGLTAFWLAHYVTRAYWPSLAAGYAFAFCAFRFAHAPGHLHLISTEFMPVFMLLWLITLRRPGAGVAVATALALFFVLLCDYYQFLLCVLAATVVAGWQVWPWRGLGPWRSRQGVRALVSGLVIVAFTSAPLVIAILRTLGREQVWGAHVPTWYSADLLGLFVPGWIWQYHDLTEPVWRPVGYYNETSVSIGVAVIVAAIFGLIKRRQTHVETAGMWLSIGIMCGLLALGPTLTIAAIPITDFTPYRLAEVFLPPLRLGGCPARMMIMTQLALAVLAAAGLKAVHQQHHWPRLARRGAITVFVILLVLESQPRVLPVFEPRVPRWVIALRDARQPGPVFDALRWGDSIGMFYQTIHRRPMIWGELARTPATVDRSTRRLVRQARQGDAAALAASGFRYLVVGATEPPLPLPTIHEDREARVYELNPSDPSLAAVQLNLPPPARRAVQSFQGLDEMLERE